MKRTRVPITVSLPSNLAENFEKLAKAESKNKSQLFREMLTAYELLHRRDQPLGERRGHVGGLYRDDEHVGLERPRRRATELRFEDQEVLVWSAA